MKKHFQFSNQPLSLGGKDNEPQDNQPPRVSSKHQISQEIVFLLLLPERMGNQTVVSSRKITSQKGYPFWPTPTHINSLPISLFRTASMLDFLHPFFVVRIHKLQFRPSMPMSPRQSQGGATCTPQMAWVPFLFLRH
jgi:hypothetical protein